MSIEIQNLTKLYSAQKALDSVNLSFKKNTTTGLLGPNGAGKTTLMNCITNIINYNEGNIIIEEKNQTENLQYLKSIIGFLPENNPLYPEMYIKEYLSFVAEIYSISKNTIEETMDRVGLMPEKNKKLKQLSKGYKQRVGLAQAIIHNPKYLILDEPTNGLDPNQILEIRKLITELAQEKTVILSTHIMQEVEALCSEVVLINQGKIVSHNSIQEFKGKYRSLEEAFFEYTHT